MENKLVFEPTTLTQYQWNKYELFSNYLYKWKQYTISPVYEYTYYWTKHYLLGDTVYSWKKYNAVVNRVPKTKWTYNIYQPGGRYIWERRIGYETHNYRYTISIFNNTPSVNQYGTKLYYTSIKPDNLVDTVYVDVPTLYVPEMSNTFYHWRPETFHNQDGTGLNTCGMLDYTFVKPFIYHYIDNPNPTYRVIMNDGHYPTMVNYYYNLNIFSDKSYFATIQEGRQVNYLHSPNYLFFLKTDDRQVTYENADYVAVVSDCVDLGEIEPYFDDEELPADGYTSYNGNYLNGSTINDYIRKLLGSNYYYSTVEEQPKYTHSVYFSNTSSYFDVDDLVGYRLPFVKTRPVLNYPDIPVFYEGTDSNNTYEIDRIYQFSRNVNNIPVITGFNCNYAGGGLGGYGWPELDTYAKANILGHLVGKYYKYPEYAHRVIAFNVGTSLNDIENIPNPQVGVSTVPGNLIKQQVLISNRTSNYYGEDVFPYATVNPNNDFYKRYNEENYAFTQPSNTISQSKPYWDLEDEYIFPSDVDWSNWFNNITLYNAAVQQRVGVQLVSTEDIIVIQGYTIGDYIYDVTTNEDDTYPHNYVDELEDYYYIYCGSFNVTNGHNISKYHYDSVNDTNEFLYTFKSYRNILEFNTNPDENGIYYIISEIDNPYCGDLIEEVNSKNRYLYPDNDSKDGFYYLYDRYTSEIIDYKRGEPTGTIVSSTNSSAYPREGVLELNWYSLYDTEVQYSKGNQIKRVTSFIQSAFPQNSYIVNDGWYVYYGSTEILTGKLTIDNTQLMGGVNYTQEINPSEDLMIGAGGAAQVDFTIYAPDAAATTQYLGKDFTYYVRMNSDEDWRQMGIFTLTTAELPDKQTAKIEGFDYIYKFDVNVDEWLNSLTFPMTLGNFFNSLCQYVGCEAYSTEFNNSSFQVNDNFEAVQITGRTILQYITEVSGGFCVAEPDGRIHIKQYSIPPTGTINLGNDSYVKYTHEIYNVPVITSVVVRKDDEDEGVESNV